MVRKDSCRCFSVGFAPVFWQSAANIDLSKGINRDTPFALCVICEAFCLLQKSFYVFVLSLPIRGVWIEIGGMKLARGVEVRSLPIRGVWIEI